MTDTSFGGRQRSAFSLIRLWVWNDSLTARNSAATSWKDLTDKLRNVPRTCQSCSCIYVLFFLENVGRHCKCQRKPKCARMFFTTFRTFERIFFIYQNTCGFSSYHIYRNYRSHTCPVLLKHLFASIFRLVRFRFHRTVANCFVEYRKGEMFRIDVTSSAEHVLDLSTRKQDDYLFSSSTEKAVRFSDV